MKISGSGIVRSTAVFIGMYAVLAFPAPLTAQNFNAGTSYAGTLEGKCTPLRGRPIQIFIQGDQVKGTYITNDGSQSRFEGKLQENKFSLLKKTQRGDEQRFTGTVENDKIDLRFESNSNCTYNASLKKI